MKNPIKVARAFNAIATLSEKLVAISEIMEERKIIAIDAIELAHFYAHERMPEEQQRVEALKRRLENNVKTAANLADAIAAETKSFT